MSQHDYVIDNQDGASFRADINNALAAIVSQNSGLTAPENPYAFMLWMDTTAGVLKQRNAANTAWVALVDAIAAAPLSRLLTRGTAQATTSGTAKDFTGIQSWAKRITITLSGVSTSGTSLLLVQIGDGSFATTGYDSGASIGGTGIVSTTSTAGFIFEAGGGGGAGTSRHGTLTLHNVSGNIWVSSHVGSYGTYGVAFIAGGGSKTLSGVLDRVRLTTVNGTDTFDAGSVNILYE